MVDPSSKASSRSRGRAGCVVAGSHRGRLRGSRLRCGRLRVAAGVVAGCVVWLRVVAADVVVCHWRRRRLTVVPRALAAADVVVWRVVAAGGGRLSAGCRSRPACRRITGGHRKRLPHARRRATLQRPATGTRNRSPYPGSRPCRNSSRFQNGAGQPGCSPGSCLYWSAGIVIADVSNFMPLSE